MEKTKFEVVSLNCGAFAINDHGRTVALVTNKGIVDWLLLSPLQKGPLIEKVLKETHLSYTLGLAFHLNCPVVVASTSKGPTKLVKLSHQVEKGGSQVKLIGECSRKDGLFTSRTEAVLGVTAAGDRYEWKVRTVFTNASTESQTLARVEYTNIYPSLAYRGFLHGKKKEFNCTLIVDENGIIWRFPHQHSMSYGRKIKARNFKAESWGGFFGSKKSSPIVRVTASDLPLDWGICDMFYDLHCCVRGPHVLAPGGSFAVDYFIEYLSPAQAATHVKASKAVEIDEEDRARHDYPRFDFGLNQFNRGVTIDRPDEACCYRPKPPEKAWDREIGHKSKGSLRLTSEGAKIVWTNEPPIHAVNGTKLCISAKVLLKDVGAQGFHLCLRHYNILLGGAKVESYPITTVKSDPLKGTTDGWVPVTLAELEIPAGEVEDSLIRLELVLEDKGTAWVTDIDVEMKDVEPAAVEEDALVTTV